MSYPDLTTEKNIQDILHRKEFATLKYDTEPPEPGANPNSLDQKIVQSGRLFLNTYQKFVSNWINVNTQYTRLLVKHDPGMGKTAGVLTAVMPFISEYHRMFRLNESKNQNKYTPSIYVIGFSEHVFYRELFKRPEFGYITRDEINELNKLKKMYESTGLKSDRDVLIDFKSMLKKRLSRKERRGFFKFYGYKEFFNKLFIFDADSNSKISADPEISALASTDKSMIEQQLIIAIRKKYILLNVDLLDRMANSVVICDEIHNVYNSQEMNNYGVALRMATLIYDVPDTMYELLGCVLDGRNANDEPRLETMRNSDLRLVLLTATPINSSPHEVIDLLNILIPVSKINMVNKKLGRPADIRLYKSDFFSGPRELRDGISEHIAFLVRGYVSFLSDTNSEHFPSVALVGDQIPVPAHLAKANNFTGKFIPYLKFRRCIMSKLHLATYKNMNSNTVMLDSLTILDMVVPDPDNPKIGLYKTRDIKKALSNASPEYTSKYGMSISEQIINNSSVWLISGEWAKLENIKKFSSKYYNLLVDVLDNLKNNGGKNIISHQRVKVSGVLCIQTILRQNGIIDEDSNPAPNTRCSMCGTELEHHPESHQFIPARFITLYGDIDKATRDRSAERFDSLDNVHGYVYRFLIGSPVINESIDFNNVNAIRIMYRPNDISSLIQIIGRAVRRGSHLLQDPSSRHVNVYIYTSALPGDELSYEEQAYFEKSLDYLVVQQIDLILNREAVDSPLNASIISNNMSKTPGLGKLYFEPEGMSLSKITSTTFDIFYSNEEVNTVLYIIKRLFIEQSQVWTYADLFNAVLRPPFRVPFLNTSLISELSFTYALNSLLWNPRGEQTIVDIYAYLNKSTNIVDRILNPMDKCIPVDGTDCKISKIGKYFILFPIRYAERQKRNDNRNYIEKTERRTVVPKGSNVAHVSGLPDIDIENWSRYSESIENTRVNITRELQTLTTTYEQMKLKFYRQYSKQSITAFPTSLEIYGFDFHVSLVQNAIAYVFNILTDADTGFSELHDFYFKLLYFYDRLDLIVYACNIEDTSEIEQYKPYITESNLAYGFHDYDSKVGADVLKHDHRYNAFLMDSILKSAGIAKPFNLDRMNNFLGKLKSTGSTPKKTSRKHIKLSDVSDVNIRKAKNIHKVFSNLLPVGHFLTEPEKFGSSSVMVPVLYNIESGRWLPAPKIISQLAGKNHSNERENDILIGYYDKNPAGIELRFKTRRPNHMMENYTDARKIERGSDCQTHKRHELNEICKKLGIPIPDEDNIKYICSRIKLELMSREMAERRKLRADIKPDHVKIRWFYMHFETQPSR